LFCAGNYWQSVTDEHCHDEVWLHPHDAGDPELDATDFLEFVARRGLRRVSEPPAGA
jgi:hypothetical protein